MCPPHHIQKVVAFFQSNAEFCWSPQKAGHEVLYFTLSVENAQRPLGRMITNWSKKEGFEIRSSITSWWVYRPGSAASKNFRISWIIQNQERWSEHFYRTKNILQELFQRQKDFLMETLFISDAEKILTSLMRKQTHRRKWNFDAENRSALKDNVLWRKPKLHPKICEVTSEMIDKSGSEDHRNYWWNSIQLALTSRANRWKSWIISVKSLVHFGDTQMRWLPGPFSFSSSWLCDEFKKMLSPWK